METACPGNGMGFSGDDESEELGLDGARPASGGEPVSNQTSCSARKSSHLLCLLVSNPIAASKKIRPQAIRRGARQRATWRRSSSSRSRRKVAKMDPRSGWEGKDEPARRGEDGGVIEGCGGVLFGLLAQAITLVCENCLKLLRRDAALPEAGRWGGCRYRLPTSPGPEGP